MARQTRAQGSRSSEVGGDDRFRQTSRADRGAFSRHASSSATNRAAVDSSLPTGGGTAPLPSEGSSGHPDSCKPCAHIWRPAGCIRGADCTHCHFCTREDFMRYKKFRKNRRARRRRVDDDEEEALAPSPSTDDRFSSKSSHLTEASSGLVLSDRGESAHLRPLPRREHTEVHDVLAKDAEMAAKYGDGTRGSEPYSDHRQGSKESVEEKMSQHENTDMEVPEENEASEEGYVQDPQVRTHVDWSQTPIPVRNTFVHFGADLEETFLKTWPLKQISCMSSSYRSPDASNSPR